ncbi:MAG: hypothetical protein HKN08_04600 [Gammaproteobacteria bacterium]|nr:hypothetical protein [Gammaproteobacteria bacterium]
MLACLVAGLTVTAWAHVPIPLDQVPAVVLESVKVREPGMTILEAAVDVSHSTVPNDTFVTTYVIKGTTTYGKDVAVEVTSSGLVLQVYDREYFEEFIED